MVKARLGLLMLLGAARLSIASGGTSHSAAPVRYMPAHNPDAVCFPRNRRRPPRKHAAARGRALGEPPPLPPASSLSLRHLHDPTELARPDSQEQSATKTVEIVADVAERNLLFGPTPNPQPQCPLAQRGAEAANRRFLSTSVARKDSDTCKGYCQTKGGCSDYNNHGFLTHADRCNGGLFNDNPRRGRDGYYCCCNARRPAQYIHDCGYDTDQASCLPDEDGKCTKDYAWPKREDPFKDKGYDCDNAECAVYAKVKSEQVSPLAGEIPFQAGYAFAHDVAEWAYELLGETKESMPLRYAFYTNGDRTKDEECEQNGEVKSDLACQFLKAKAELPERAGKFVLGLLKRKDRNTDWLQVQDLYTDKNGRNVSFKDSVLGLGYTPFAEFIAPICGEDPDGKQGSNCSNVYVPNHLLDPWGSYPTFEDFAEKADQNSFWGSTSGGGSGASLTVSCVDGFTTKIIVSGAASGGGGFTSPQFGSGVEAGGGAGGGAQVGSLSFCNASALVGAGAGNHPPGLVEMNRKCQPKSAEFTHRCDLTEWVDKMNHAKLEMRECFSNPTKNLTVTGEGSGGFGYQIFQRFDVKNASINPIQNQTVSIGFRFAFALGQGEKALIRDTQAPAGDRTPSPWQGKAYVFCERNGKGDCTSGEYENAPEKGCVDTKLHPDDGVMSNSTKAKGCMGAVVSFICGEARKDPEYKNDLKGEGWYKNCQKPLETLYKKEYTQDSPSEGQGQGCEGGQSSEINDNDITSEINKADITAHKEEWCPTAGDKWPDGETKLPPGCDELPMPGC